MCCTHFILRLNSERQRIGHSLGQLSTFLSNRLYFLLHIQPIIYYSALPTRELWFYDHIGYLISLDHVERLTDKRPIRDKLRSTTTISQTFNRMFLLLVDNISTHSITGSLIGLMKTTVKCCSHYFLLVDIYSVLCVRIFELRGECWAKLDSATYHGAIFRWPSLGLMIAATGLTAQPRNPTFG